MKDAARLTERFRQCFSYDAETGHLTRVLRTAPMHKVGERVGYKHKGHGYMVLALDYKSYLAHRVIWVMMHGEWPKGEIDHINGDRTDNRLCNLRDIPKSLNQFNRRGLNRKDNTSGRSGVFERSGKFRVIVGGSKNRQHLGTYATFEEAVAVRDAAHAKIWQEARV